jgi:hypothetical protein
MMGRNRVALLVLAFACSTGCDSTDLPDGVGDALGGAVDSFDLPGSTGGGLAARDAAVFANPGSADVGPADVGAADAGSADGSSPRVDAGDEQTAPTPVAEPADAGISPPVEVDAALALPRIPDKDAGATAPELDAGGKQPDAGSVPPSTDAAVSVPRLPPIRTPVGGGTQSVPDAGSAVSPVPDAAVVAPPPATQSCTASRRVASGVGITCVDEGVNTVSGEVESNRQAADQAYASMPPVRYAPPADRFQHLATTRNLLCCRGDLNVVMMGDSIVYDASVSRWEEYLAEATGARIHKTTSLYGGHGSLWYAESPRVYCAALRYAPDLVVLGGISQIDIPAMRSEIEQIKAASSAEVLLTTPAFGYVDPRDPAQWTYSVDAAGDSVRAQMKRLADELQVGFFDMAAEWGNYVVDSGRDVSSFKRDELHANTQGQQIMGRLLTAHMDPRVGGNFCQ